MSILTAIALDDEPPALRLLETFAQANPSLSLLKTFTRPDEATDYLKQNKVDLLFLDIQMPTISGIDFYKQVQAEAIAPNLRVIFTTAFSHYAVEGFNLAATDYLLKPFTLERFNIAVEKLQPKQTAAFAETNEEPDFLTLKSDYILHKVKIATIVYIESLGDYLHVHTETIEATKLRKHKIVVRMTLKTILEKLPATLFLRVHRSFIIPIDRVTAWNNKFVFLDDIEIPIGTTYEGQFKAIFN